VSAKRLLEQLERACQEQGVKLVYGELRGEGGLCRLRTSYYIIINRRASTETRIRIIQQALERLKEMVQGGEPAQSEIGDQKPEIRTLNSEL